MTWWRWPLLAAAVPIAGVPAAAGTWVLSRLSAYLSDAPAIVDPAARALHAAAVNTAVALTVIVAVAVFVPWLWRHQSHQGTLRLLALTAVTVTAAGVGVLIPGYWPGLVAADLLGGLGLVAWWGWQRRWRGAGVAPSPLSGILRPLITPGQVWFAFVPGAHRDKVRPVLVLATPEPGRWLVAYFTTQPPPAHRAHEYLPTSTTGLRGLPDTGWLRLTDTRQVNRKAFRIYVGLAPHALYEAACTANNLTADPAARTLIEERPGRGLGPGEQAVRAVLLPGSHATPTRSPTLGTVTDMVSAWRHRPRSPNPPPPAAAAPPPVNPPQPPVR